MIDKTWYERPANVKERISAGGVVVRRADNGTLLVALVRERDFPEYVLPKGGIESGETLEQAARREIEEEAGLRELHLLAKLGQLERLSYSKVYWIITHIFVFQTTQIKGIPTDAENHHGVWWFPLDDLPPMWWPEQRDLIIKHRSLIASLVND